MTGGNVRARKVWASTSAAMSDHLLPGRRRGRARRHGRGRGRARPRQRQSLAAGYGYTGILVSFLARHNPLAIIPVAILLGGIGASGGLLQRRLDLPDASVLVLQGIIFVAILASETLYGRLCDLRTTGRPADMADGIDRLVGRAARRARRARSASARRSSSSASANASPSARGRINLGLEGTLVMGAMSGYGVSY